MAEGKKPKTEKTIIEYAYENRDKTFSELPFNDIDNVILSEISYISFENVIADEKNMKPMTLHELLLFISTESAIKNIERNLLGLRNICFWRWRYLTRRDIGISSFWISTMSSAKSRKPNLQVCAFFFPTKA